MKKIVVLIIIVFFSIELHAQGHFVFGVKHSADNSSAYAGVYHKKIMPYIGVDFMQLKSTFNYSDPDIITLSNDSTRYKIFSLELDVKALLVIPKIGVKYFLNENVVRPYILADLFIGLPSVKLDTRAQEETWIYKGDRQIDHGTETVNLIQTKELEKSITDALGFWGISFGLGAEYVVHPNFTVGAEYGFRIITSSTEYVDLNPDYKTSSPSTEFINDWKAVMTAQLQLSYALFSMNFYF